MIGPGAGGVDHHRGAEIAGRRGGDPLAVVARQRVHRRPAGQLAALPRRAAQKPAMQKVHIHVHRRRLEQAAGDHRARQIGRPVEQRVAVQTFGHRAQGVGVAFGLVEDRFGLGGRRQQGAARGQHRPVDETLGWMAEEITARRGDRADHPIAIGLGVQRRRAAGGVVAGRVLHLEDLNLAVAGQVEGGGGAGDAAADHQEIAVMGHRLSPQVGKPEV